MEADNENPLSSSKLGIKQICKTKRKMSSELLKIKTKLK